MRTLYFEINGQTLRKIDNFSGIIKGSKQYLKCHFAVKDPEWTGMGIVAVFEKINLPSSAVLSKTWYQRLCIERRFDKFFWQHKP